MYYDLKCQSSSKRRLLKRNSKYHIVVVGYVYSTIDCRVFILYRVIIQNRKSKKTLPLSSSDVSNEDYYYRFLNQKMIDYIRTFHSNQHLRRLLSSLLKRRSVPVFFIPIFISCLSIHLLEQ